MWNPRLFWLSLVAVCPLLLGVAACCECPEEPAADDGGSTGDTPPASDGTIPARTDADGNHTISSFEAAKRRLPGLFAGHEETFYCGCRYRGDEVDLKSCGYVPRKNEDRARRIEWEHVVPAQSFGQSFKSWREGHPDCVDSKGEPYKGRRCAEKVEGDFKRMEADLYNLRPAIGEVNGDRSNYTPAMLEGEERAYGKCDVEIDSGAGKIEPRPEIRGDVARAYLYMDWAYPGRGVVSNKNRKLFAAWSKQDPPDGAERDWARRVQKLQGNRNPFIP